MPEYSLATFRVDVTPPTGHPLCGGWIKPVESVTDPMYALGIVLVGDEAPVVLCAVDWCEIRNRDHTLWREKLAEAVGTVPDRVAVQCVHQHNAPLTDLDAQELIAGEEGLPALMDAEWFMEALDRVSREVQSAMSRARPATHIALGQAAVEKVASNRRILSPDGKVKGIRWSACKEPELRDEPEGLIDPVLKTISFWNHDAKLVSLHYYATHPMSYYGDGKVTSDFAGLARERRAAEDAGVMHIYFTGCAGDITAGKYNDGSPESRSVLSERIYKGMVESEREMELIPLDHLEWKTKQVVFPLLAGINEADLLKTLTDPAQSGAARQQTALGLAYLRRAQVPTPLTSLHLSSKVCILHLPGEPFVEYQWHAQRRRPDGFIAVAGYGDGGTGYIPLAKSYAEGGYEPTATYLSPDAEAVLKREIEELLEVL